MTAYRAPDPASVIGRRDAMLREAEAACGAPILGTGGEHALDLPESKTTLRVTRPAYGSAPRHDDPAYVYHVEYLNFLGQPRRLESTREQALEECLREIVLADARRYVDSLPPKPPISDAARKRALEWAP